MTIASGIIVLFMTMIKNSTGTILFSIFFGFFQGGAIALTPAIVTHLAQEPAEIGSRMGVVFVLGGFVGLFGSFFSPTPGGAFHSQTSKQCPLAAFY